MFLDKNNVCTIYNQRPAICRLYPLLWKRDSSGKNEIFIDVSCPLVYEIPLKEIISWSKDQKNTNQMRKMGSLDFDGRYRNYINFTQLKSYNKSLSLIDEFNSSK